MAIETTLVGEITTALYKKKYYEYPTLKYVEPDTGYVVYTTSNQSYYGGNAFLMNPLDPADMSGDFGQLTITSRVDSALLAYVNDTPLVGSIIFGRIDPVSGTVYALSRTGSVLSETATRFRLPATAVRTGAILRIGEGYYFRTGASSNPATTTFTPFDPDTFEVDAASAIRPGSQISSQDNFLLHSSSTGKSYIIIRMHNVGISGTQTLVA